jgi:DNA-directed RNA polymerase specialized sigma24 family protein
MSTRGLTAGKIYLRLELQVKKIVLTLKTQLGLYYDTDIIMNEAQNKFIKLFDYYEDDQQYLRFMFSVIKNLMRDIRKKEIKFHKFHVTTSSASFSIPGYDNSHDDHTILEQIAVDTKREINPLHNMEVKDVVELVAKSLKREVHREIFLHIVEGKSNIDIAQELGYSASYISVIRVRYIWPLVQKIMNISDHDYFRLTDSGRVNCVLSVDLEE